MATLSDVASLAEQWGWTVFDCEDGDILIQSQFHKPGQGVKITPGALAKLSPISLENVAFGGRNVDHITRVTGYFSKTSAWNPGKLAELRDRKRTPLEERVNE